MTFAEFCEEALDTPLTEYQKHICDAIEEKYRKDGNFDSRELMIGRGAPRSLTLVCTQLITLFSLYVKCEEESDG